MAGRQRATRGSRRKLEILASLGLADDALQRVADLPYGKQRLVEIAIALATARRCCCSTSRRPACPRSNRSASCDVLDTLPKEIAILIIEHDMELVFRFAQRITVLVQGEVLTEGTPAEIAADRRVHDVYLGEDPVVGRDGSDDGRPA